MAGEYTKRKIKKFLLKVKEKYDDVEFVIRKFFVKLFVRNKDFTIISNNCWAGKVYQYLDLPYLSPTVGLYFFAPDYIKFVSDLRRYLDTPLKFIKPNDSKYYDELIKRNQTDKPIGVLDDVEIVFLHYKTEEEAEEKWNRRKERVNYDHIILKFSRMDLCTEKELKTFDSLSFQNKFILNNRFPLVYKSEVYWKEDWKEEGIYRDTTPFPGNLRLNFLLDKPQEIYPENGLKTMTEK